MRPQLPIVAGVVATVLFLFSSPSFAEKHGRAEKHRPHSFRVEKADVSEKAPVGARGCETNPFPTPDLGGFVCYGPSAIRAAYGLTGLISRYTGAGQTIVILAAFGSPTVLADLKMFDKFYGLPDPVFIEHLMDSSVSTANEDDQTMWAREVSRDVQWSHAMAPGAKIVLVAAASDSDEDLLAGLNYAIDNFQTDVISMSFGKSEKLYLDEPDGLEKIEAWETAFTRARAHRITLFASSGDEGSTNAVDDFGDVLGVQDVRYPASSPQVTAVGGTSLFFGKAGHAGPEGTYVGETVWNDAPNGVGAGGGGVSSIFTRPGYQDALRSSVQHEFRGVPDVAYNAGRMTGMVVYEGFPADSAGYYVVGGTGGGAPQWAGIIADLNQALGRNLGFINDNLYRLGQAGVKEHKGHRRGERYDRDGDRDHDRANLFHDITAGDNGFCGYTVTTWDAVCVEGFNAKRGWDLATGWGTPNFGALMVLVDQWDDDDHNYDHDDDDDDDRK